MNTDQLLVCQGCGAPLTRTLVDLGLSPLANSYEPLDKVGVSSQLYPLHARVCDDCFLVQVESVVPAAAIFHEYAYFSSYSDSWLRHCKEYVEKMTERFELNASSQVVEIASNDGYLLQYFIDRNIPSLGVEPAANVAKVARSKGVPTDVAFFGVETAERLEREGHAADLLAAKNVLAHVPAINDFVGGVKILLKPEGVFTVEFPHLLNMINEVQFDTIYHEHYTYLSLLAVERIFARHGLRVFDVEEVPTHGGSLRVFVCHNDSRKIEHPGVGIVRKKEAEAKLDSPEGYLGYTERVEEVRDNLLMFLNDAKRAGKTVIGYGAAAKGNTLLNYAKVTTDQLALVVDLSTAKQNKLLPGSHIRVAAPDVIASMKPDYILILPWNLKEEIEFQLDYVRSWGCRFVTAIPTLSLD